MTDASNGDTSRNKRPVQSLRDGTLEVAIWRRETEKGPVFNTERKRSYRNKDGEWQKSSVIPERDLLKAAHLDQKAYESIQQLRDKERSQYVEKQQSLNLVHSDRPQLRER